MSFLARPPIRRMAAVLGLAMGGVMLVSPGTPGSASTADEATLVSLVNGARTSAGLAPLTVSAALTETARSHSAAMAAAGTLFHSGNLAGAVGDSVAWTSVAENVAVAGSVTEAHQRLMGSSTHRAHILGDYTLLGVGVATGGDGRVWVTEHFAKAPTTTVAPAPTTTTTSTTTTTTAVPVEASITTAAAATPTPAPKPRPARRTAVRTTTVRSAAAPPAASDVSCLPPQAQDHGQGHAYGRCEDGPAAAASDGQGRSGR